MRLNTNVLVLWLGSVAWRALASGVNERRGRNCFVQPLGPGLDDTTYIENAIRECGKGGHTTFAPGDYNITRKMTWELENSRVDLNGYLSFVPDIDYWLLSNSTYRVVFIQSQASWFVVTGSDFVIDAHGQGGINGNGQTWWDYFQNHTRADGDGRPISLTLKNVTRGTIKDFRIESPPFWMNCVADSTQVVYDGMYGNATNTNPEWAGQNVVPNTDGIDTYRSNDVQLLNWDITCGDDAIAIKGNSSNIVVSDLIVRGGNGIAFGSLGQYQNLSDLVENVTMSNVQLLRLPTDVQPNLNNGVYLKSWTGTSSGSPPTSGGGGDGYARNIILKNFTLDRVSIPTHIYQTNGGHTSDTPSYLKFSNISWIDWTGTTTGSVVADIACSSNAPCDNLTFTSFNISVPVGSSAEYECSNAEDVSGAPGC